MIASKFTSGFHPKLKSGFHLAVFIQQVIVRALQYMSWYKTDLSLKVRLLFISSKVLLLDLIHRARND